MTTADATITLYILSSNGTNIYEDNAKAFKLREIRMLRINSLPVIMKIKHVCSKNINMHYKLLLKDNLW